MQINKNGHKKRTKRAHLFWIHVVQDYNNGLTPIEIAQRYISPKTGKAYDHHHICLILKKLRKLTPEELKEFMSV